MTDLTEQDKECLRQLRKNGCAVTVFLPHEVGEADIDEIEERMCISGWDAINEANPGKITV